MKVPLSWLREYVNITVSPEELAHTLTMAGLEVEAIEYIGSEWGDKIISAQIDHLEKVAGSDHLSYTRVNTGKEVFGVVCGAPNIRQGDKVPLALVGAKVGDITITAAKKMGYVSEGMLCSPRELGLGNDHSGIYILDPNVEIGQRLVDILGEVVFDFSIKAHRGDLSSIIGIAREVAALTGQELRIPVPVVHERGTSAKDMVRITVEDATLCPRYTVRIVSDLKIGSSPNWMRHRLLAAGIRSINNVVDITNYVMLEFGQPLHGFDYDLIRQRHVIVRRAHAGETITTLDDVKRTLTPDMLIITDPEGPTGIAGVMGGAISEVNDKTTTVLIEAANFNASNVRRTSVALGLRTDASSRFEKGLDPQLTIIANNRAAQLMEELAGGTTHPDVIDFYPHPRKPRVIAFSPDEVEWLTGLKVTPQEVVDTLTALTFEVIPDEAGKVMDVIVPTYRADIEEGADLVEEVLRMVGYNNIPSTIPVGPLPEPQHESWFLREQEVRDILVGAGLNEIVTYAMTSRARMVNLLAHADTLSARALIQGPKRVTPHGLALTRQMEAGLVPFDARSIPAVTITNPLSNELEAMRLTLMSGLLETLHENSKHNTTDLRFFEVGRRYLPAEQANSQPHELKTVGMVICGPADISWLPEIARPADFYDLKGIVETLLNRLHITRYHFTPTQHPTFHPGRCALVELPRRSAEGTLFGEEVKETFSPIGVLGEVHPIVQERYDLPYRAYLCEIDLELLYAAVPTMLSYTPILRQQALTRDLAIVVDRTVLEEDIADEIRRSGGELLRSVTLFDVYTGEPIPADRKNLTYSLVYQAQDRTLTDAEANTLQERIIRALHDKFGAELR